MSPKYTNYEFYPSVRQGYRPSTAFAEGRHETPVSGRNTLGVTLDVQGHDGSGWQSASEFEGAQQPSLDVTLYGPGDVTGVDHDQVVRVEPSEGATNFPPNYFPLVEFDSPDLPWMFSPEYASDESEGKGSTRPWMTLVVVDRSRSEITQAGDRPVPTLTTPADELPDPDEAWAWAHAQVVGDATTSDPDELAETFRSGGSTVTSRLLCPRNLSADTSYYACVVPTFEPGRRTGLGTQPYEGMADSSDSGDGKKPESPQLSLAWSPDDDEVVLPVYYRWEFGTGAEGDFEALARALDPVEFGSGIGYRTVDVSRPGPDRLKVPAEDGSSQSTVGMGGALKSPRATPDPYDDSESGGPANSVTLRRLLNRPAAITDRTDTPVVGPPLYGQWHAGAERLPTAETDYFAGSWFEQLNVDPRYRVPAGFGAAVIRESQEEYARRAWEEVPDLDEVNRKLRSVQFGRLLSNRIHSPLRDLDLERLVQFTSPIHEVERFEEAVTIREAVESSALPVSAVSPTFRRLTQPNNRIVRQFEDRGLESVDDGDLAGQFDRGEVRPGGRVTESDRLRTFGDGTRIGEHGLGEEGLTIDEGDGEGVDGGDGGAVDDGEGYQFMMGSVGDAGDSGPGDGAGGDAGPAGEAEPVRDARVTIESAESHVDTTRDRLAALEDALDRDARAELVELLAEPPTLRDHAESVRRNTFRGLNRSIEAFFAADADVAPEGFTRERAREHFGTLDDRHRELLAAVDGVLAAVESETADREREGDAGARPDRTESPEEGDASLPAEVGSAVEQTHAALDGVEGALSDLRSALGVDVLAQPMMAESDALGETPFDSLAALQGAPEGGWEAQTLYAGESLAESEGADDLIDLIDPEKTMVDEAARAVTQGEWLRTRGGDPVEEVLASPTFTDPMYRELAALSQQYLCPGVDDIPADSVGALETNPEFIEAFMAGLNHEMARELLWRRYPTDRRGTYFNTFWDYRGPTDDDDSEKPPDVGPMHEWDRNELGANSPSNVGSTGAASAEDLSRVVLLVRGELLRRYPNTRIYAAKAVEEKNESESTADERVTDRVPALSATPDKNAYPTQYARKDYLFRGRVDPDVTFFGFDLTSEEAVGHEDHETESADGDGKDALGWFFVLEEPVGETRFGLDADPVGRETDVGSNPPGVELSDGSQRSGDGESGWDALSWGHMVPPEGQRDGVGATPDGIGHVDVDGHRPAGKDGKGGDAAWKTTEDGDLVAEWGRNSAHMARITWQRPVRISIHADDLLPDVEESGADLTDVIEDDRTTDRSDGTVTDRTGGSDYAAEAERAVEEYFDGDGDGS